MEDDVTSLLESTVLVWKKIKIYEREVTSLQTFFDAEESFGFDPEEDDLLASGVTKT